MTCRAIVSTVFLVVAGTTAAFAQTPPCAISVLGYGARPGGSNIPEAYVEIRNHGTDHCRVSITRTTANPQQYIDCPDCTHAPCGSAPGDGEGGYLCTTSNASTVEIGPCNHANFCASANDCMPGAGSIEDMCCDNKANPNACNPVLNTSAEFCQRYVDMLVVVTAHKAPGKLQQWQATNDVVCVKGSYEALYPTAGVCNTAEYCDESFGSRSYRQACQPEQYENCWLW